MKNLLLALVLVLSGNAFADEGFQKKNILGFWDMNTTSYGSHLRAKITEQTDNSVLIEECYIGNSGECLPSYRNHIAIYNEDLGNFQYRYNENVKVRTGFFRDEYSPKQRLVNLQVSKSGNQIVKTIETEGFVNTLLWTRLK